MTVGELTHRLLSRHKLALGLHPDLITKREGLHLMGEKFAQLLKTSTQRLPQLHDAQRN